MRVALITEPESEFGAGVGRYSRCLVEAFACQRSAYEFLLISDRATPRGAAARFTPRHIPRYYRGPGSTYLWYFTLPLRVAGVRLVHNLSQIPTGFSFAADSVVTVHDLSPLSLPRAHRPLKKWIYRAFLPGMLTKARAVIAVSDATRRELTWRYPGVAPRVRTIAHGVEPIFRVVTDDEEKERVRRVYGLDHAFVLTVGQVERRKNLVRWLEAFSEVCRRVGSRLSLVLVGRPAFKAAEVYEAITRLDLTARVRILWPVADRDLVVLYNTAAVLVLPSLWEGFGLPALEAMACGLPVCASEAGALPEVLEGAGRFFNPYRVDEMAEVVCGVLGDAAAREEMAARGLARAREFTWERCAAATLAVYDQVLRNH